MNKLVKGAIATGVGVVLLMGGAGTLAYWNASANTSAATITAGNLTATSGTAGVWKSGTTTINPATFRTVPGDVLTYTQDVTLDASGDNLKFTVGLGNAALTIPTTFVAPVTSAASTELKNQILASAVYSIGGANIAPVSGQPNTYKVATAGTTTITVTVTLTHGFQGGTINNASQNGAVILGANALTFAQVQ